MSRADTARQLLDAGWSPIEAHEAVTQGTVSEEDLTEPTIIEQMEAASGR